MARSMVFAFAVFIAMPAAASGHVGLLTPPVDAMLETGSVVEISWETVIPHNTRYWQIDISYDGGDRWEVVAEDILPSVFSYEWIPDTPCSTCLLRVTQDNASTDYIDTVTILIEEKPVANDGCSMVSLRVNGGLFFVLFLLTASWVNRRRLVQKPHD